MMEDLQCVPLFTPFICHRNQEAHITYCINDIIHEVLVTATFSKHYFFVTQLEASLLPEKNS